MGSVKSHDTISEQERVGMMEGSLKLYKSLDLTGSSCAGVIGELSGVYEELQAGEYLEALVKATAEKKDIYAWASRVGAQIVSDKPDAKGSMIFIAKVK